MAKVLYFTPRSSGVCTFCGDYTQKTVLVEGFDGVKRVEIHLCVACVEYIHEEVISYYGTSER